MSRFKWSASHEVYVPELDAEHRELFRCLEGLQQAASNGANTQAVRALAKRLVEEVTAHFGHEERLMDETGYQAREWHKRQHRTALEAAAPLVRSISRGRMEAVAELLEFMEDWLHNHTSVTDRMMGAWLRAARRQALARAS